jgi:hypothetical protein
MAAAALTVLDFDEVIGHNQPQLAPKWHGLTQVGQGAKGRLFTVAHNISII